MHTYNSDIYILFCCLVNRANGLFGGRVNGLESLAIDTLYEFVVDEAEIESTSKAFTIKTTQGAGSWGKTHRPVG